MEPEDERRTQVSAPATPPQRPANEAAVTEDGPHPRVELVTIATRPESQGFSPAVPSWTPISRAKPSSWVSTRPGQLHASSAVCCAQVSTRIATQWPIQ
jgi:hypothetical protein